MRLFLTIELPEDIKDYLFIIKNKFSRDLAKVNWVAKKNLHLSLKFLGEVDDILIPKIIQKLNEIKFNIFKLELDNIDVFPNKNYVRVLWVGLKNFNKVIELQQDIDDRLSEFFNKEKEFSAHITLGRVKSVKNKNDFFDLINNLKIKNLGFEVSSFSLIKSELSKDCPKYTNLEGFFLNKK